MVNLVEPSWRRIVLPHGAPSTDATADLTRLIEDAASANPGALVVEISTAVDQHGEQLGIPDWTRWEKAIRRVERVEIPTIAVLGGPISGAALQLALAMDIRLGSPSTTLACSDLHEGRLPGMALYRLSQCVGALRIKRLLLTGSAIPAAEAVSLGLLDDIAADMPGLVERLVSSFPNDTGTVWKLARRLLHEAPSSSFEDALGALLAAQDRVYRKDPVGVRGAGEAS